MHPNAAPPSSSPPLLPARSWQQACCVDDHGQLLQSDLYGTPLVFKEEKQHDTMALGTIRVAYK